MRFITLLFLALPFAGPAQSGAQSDPPAFDYSTAITWSDHPVLHRIPQAFSEASAVTILDERSIEYRKEAGDKFMVYNTFHRIIRVRDDQGIEMFNKVYVLVHDGAEITDIRARTIQPDGKVVDLSQDKIKSTQEDGNDYRLFAMDGVEKGSELEYYYVEKRPFYLFASEFFQAAKVPIVKERFVLICPTELRFSAKGYNGFRVSPDSVIGDRRVIVGLDSAVEGLPDDEKYSYRDKYLKRVDFKLSYNLSGNAEVRLYTWKDFGKRAYAYYTTRSEKEDKALDGFVGDINFPDTAAGARISAAEDYVKSRIDIDKKLTSSGGDVLLQVIGTKTANEEGIIRLFAGVFDHLQIPYNFVVASDRDGIPLDPELENWDRADNILFFFPQTGGYLDPVEQGLRYPFISPELGGSQGLFLKSVDLGSFHTAIALFAPVPLLPEDSSSENLEAEVRFSPGLDTLLVHGKQILRGYAACGTRPIYTFLPKDKQEEDSKDIVKAIDASADVSNLKVTNPKLTDGLDNKPLIIEADLRCPDMIESAGNRLLLKIGNLIGIQVQMYQEKPRQLPAEMEFAHRENRTLVVHIPDGYTIRNPKDLLSDVTYAGMGFSSTYTLDGKVLTVQIREHYADLIYPLARFPEFQKVINASADFNKVVLVLEKAE